MSSWRRIQGWVASSVPRWGRCTGIGTVMNSHTLSHTPADAQTHMACHPKFGLDKHGSAQRGAGSRGCSLRWKIHRPLFYLDAIQRAQSSKNIHQLPSETQPSGHNTCMLIDVNLDTLEPIKRQATLSLPQTNACTQMLSLSPYRRYKQILSKTLLLQEIVKALASLSEYVVFVNT